ncbi:MAG: tagaturonate reductase [Clostridiales bacterium]|jgi:tagaturonate reductase|nr:tagaturonate reductase [Clostridiales bacterium]
MRKVSETVSKAERPIKILQFGEGNFLRAFADWMVDIANERGVLDAGIALVKPIEYGGLDALRSQDCVYTVLLRGRQNGETAASSRVVTSIRNAVDCYTEYEDYAALAKEPALRFIISNTTEAGIVFDKSDKLTLAPPKSYPGKLTKFLYERWLAFDGAEDKGCMVFPVELIERNGQWLLSCCLMLCELWALPEEFQEWLRECNIFCQTLVDRIVTGYPKDEIAGIEEKFGYEDKMLVTGEPFALWVIESDRIEQVRGEFPLDKAGLPVVFTGDLQPYRERKVRVLNGAHTSTALAAYLAGLNTVGEMMADTETRKLLERNVYGELLPYVPLPADEVKAFADSVMERFENPFIQHSLLSIALNSVSKFKARVLPTIKEAAEKTSAAPKPLCFSLAALMAFYSGEQRDGQFYGKRGDAEYEIMDDAHVIHFFAENKNLEPEEFTRKFLARADFWGSDLNSVNGFAENVAEYLKNIREKGAREAAASMLRQEAAVSY